MNGLTQAQLHFDFLTGRPTTVQGDVVTSIERAACTSLNRQRARGIKEATRPAPPGEPIPVDGWNALVARKAQEWNVPLIPLAKLGLSFDPDGFPISSRLRRLAAGAEATAWEDAQNRCVYKLFDLRDYALGKKLVLEVDEESNIRAVPKDATLDDTLEKICVLHEAGACPTEIVGLAESGDHLIVKQPCCYAFADFEEDRRIAATHIKAVVPRYSLGREIRILWINEQAWCVGDLHKGNIMREASGIPTIIDALIGPLPPELLRTHHALEAAVSRDRDLREGREPPSEDLFHNISDDDL